LGAHTDPNLTNSRAPNQSVRSTRHMRIAEGITNTCHESYIRTSTHLGDCENYLLYLSWIGLSMVNVWLKLHACCAL